MVRGEDWSEEEVQQTIADYFEMLRKQNAGIAFVKAEHNRKLRERLSERSKGAVEFKHMNISAVLHAHGLPWLQGYAPAAHVQQLLEDSIIRFVEARTHQDRAVPVSNGSVRERLRERVLAILGNPES